MKRINIKVIKAITVERLEECSIGDKEKEKKLRT